MTKIIIVGAGAIGSLYGGKLHQAGAEVSFICRSNYDVIKMHGINIRSTWGDFNFRPQNTYLNTNECEEEFDFAIIATKVLPQASVIDSISSILNKTTAIVLIQNGIHIENPILDKFPNHQLISGLAFVCANKIDANTTHHQDFGRLVLGNYPHKISAKTLELVELFIKAGVPCEASANIKTERWKKLIWNAAFNPMSVLCGGINTQEILRNPAAKNLAINIMQEVYMLAEADGCNLEVDVIEKNITATEKMTPYKTSMLLDFEAHREMETEAILGNALRFAKNKSVKTPYLESLYALLSCY